MHIVSYSNVSLFQRSMPSYCWDCYRVALIIEVYWFQEPVLYTILLLLGAPESILISIYYGWNQAVKIY